MKQRIIKLLESIADNHNVKVLYACESGSRAWGFPSVDSDYDVRFIYLYSTDWYLAINTEYKNDVIEHPINNGFDINGWDLRKALNLFSKSNPPLFEWLGSPITYIEKYSVIAKMRELASAYYSPVACMYHYFKMAKGNNREYLQGQKVWVKKYFYVLRPVLAVIWLERDMGVVPTEFQALVDGVVDSRKLKREINSLLEAKKEGKELDYGPRIPTIGNFIDQELKRMESAQFHKRVCKCPIDKLNKIFRDALKEVWS